MLDSRKNQIPDLSPYLSATQFIDSEHPDVVEFALATTADVDDDVARAVRL